MGKRYYRKRNRSLTGVMIRDALDVGSRMPWWGAALMGIVMFAIFYWIGPAWIVHQWESSPTQSTNGQIVRQILERRLHWIQYVGVVLGLIGGFFAVRNYFTAKSLSGDGKQAVGFFSRLLARFLE